MLEAYAHCYPGSLSIDIWKELNSELNEDAIAANLTYLYRHGPMEQVIWMRRRGERGDFIFNASGLRCTAAGMDFIVDSGRLGAILNTVTIKIHEETIQDLIRGNITESDLPPAEKNRLLKA